MSIFDHRKPAETGKSGRITFPDTRKRTIVVDGGEYAPPSGTTGIRTTPQGTIDRFDPAVGIKAVREASEFSVHQFLEPQNPTGVGATATSSTTIDITATGDPGGNDGVEIHMSTTQGSGYALETTVEDTAFNAPVEISGLTADTTYYFVLRAFLWDGEQKFAAFTAEVSATTGAGGAAPASSPSPTIAEVSRTATTMTLEATWTDVGDETSYEWWAGSDSDAWSDGSQSAANSLAENTTSVQYTATRTNLDDSTFFCLRACNASGCASHKCDGFTVAGNLTAPSGLAATNPSGSDVDLDWTDMSGASVADVTAIERRLVGGSFTEIDTVVFGVTHYDDNGLADGDYEYRVRHRDTDTGNNSPYSAIDGVTIGAGGGGGGTYPNEPVGFTTISERSFDAEAEDGWTSTSSPNYTVPVTDATAITSPSNVGRTTYPAGKTGGNSGAGSRSRSITPTSEVFFGFTFKVSSNWQGHDSGVNKILFITDNTYGGGGDPVYVSAQGANNATLNLQVRLQGPGTEQSQSLGSANLGSNLSSAAITRGTWYEIEMHFKANTGDNFNGEVHVWMNGVKTHEYTDVRFFHESADPSDHTFDSIRWNAIWGGIGDTVEGEQHQFMDHFYISAP